MHATALISEGAQRCTCCTPGETLRGATSFRLCEGNLVGKIVPFERATHAFRELRCAPSLRPRDSVMCRGAPATSQRPKLVPWERSLGCGFWCLIFLHVHREPRRGDNRTFSGGETRSCKMCRPWTHDLEGRQVTPRRSL